MAGLSLWVASILPEAHLYTFRPARLVLPSRSTSASAEAGVQRLAYKPHNTSYVVLGTVFLWFGWFGFNGGSALSANLRAAQACIVTNLAASVGGITWMLWDYRLEKKWSAVGFCSGAVSGLVAITPASGFVGSPAAVLFGVAAGTICNFATQIKYIFDYDDALDIFASHAIGGIVGNILTAFFAQKSVAGFDGITVINGGWLDGHWVQLGYQLADSTAGLSYSFVMTTIILWAMHYFPGGSLRLRCNEETEIVGVDEAEMGEFAYDYVSLDAELGPREQRHDGTTGGAREPMHETIKAKLSSELTRDEKETIVEGEHTVQMVEA